MALFALLLHAIFPARCPGCEGLHASVPSSPRLCRSCLDACRPPVPPLCQRCGDTVAAATSRGDLCVACRREPPAFVTARAAALYEPDDPPPPLVAAIHALKYRGQRGVAPALAALMVERLALPRPCVVVPVPLHPARLRHRGYNQAALIARHLARSLAQPLALRVLARRAAAPQTGLGRAARRRNLVGAFAVREPRRLGGGRVLLVDDVITTGATADGCAQALLDAGAARVDVVAAGRTPGWS